MGWAWMLSRGFVGPTLPHFTVTCSSTSMWATAHRWISLNIFARFLIKESLNSPNKIPHPKVCTIKASSLVWSFTTNAPNRFRKSFRGSPWYCFTPKRSKETGGGARLNMTCSLNNVENWSNEVMCPSGRPMNQSNVVPANVTMNNLQCMANVPPEIIIWVWKAVMWASGSSIPVKVILGVMKVVDITTFMIAWENGMGRALTRICGLCSPTMRSPKRCRSLCSSSLPCVTLHCLLAMRPDRPWIGLVCGPARPIPQPKPSHGQPWTLPLPTGECWRFPWVAVGWHCHLPPFQMGLVEYSSYRLVAWTQLWMGPSFIGPYDRRQMFLPVDLVAGWLWEQAVTSSASTGICSFL